MITRICISILLCMIAYIPVVANADALKIGVVTALTGSASPASVDYVKTLTERLSDVRHIELSVYDTKSEVSKTTSLMKNLAAHNDIDLVLAYLFSPDSGNMIAKAAAELNTPTIIMGSWSHLVQRDENVFWIGSTMADQERAAKFVADAIELPVSPMLSCGAYYKGSDAHALGICPTPLHNIYSRRSIGKRSDLTFLAEAVDLNAAWFGALSADILMTDGLHQVRGAKMSRFIRSNSLGGTFNQIHFSGKQAIKIDHFGLRANNTDALAALLEFEFPAQLRSDDFVLLPTTSLEDEAMYIWECDEEGCRLIACRDGLVENR